ncbi:MbtH family protein [Saccharothrix sp. ALI-22-I]|uniref:MbtH family protein n=1 Tax=Saccharothrix sp. ALI-22-I TaxID=1933778 RepID=UPI00097BB33F|nr:MbtH family protein [Saccharothrix sp. ALI-22-I]ONI92033.1 MbtH family protein [Saccharothrix sp. ALI-22-I]
MGERGYRVVRNDAGQYSIWPDDQGVPVGWTDAGRSGTKDECLAHIDQVWTDLRPAGVRARLVG